VIYYILIMARSRTEHGYTPDQTREQLERYGAARGVLGKLLMRISTNYPTKQELHELQRAELPPRERILYDLDQAVTLAQRLRGAGKQVCRRIAIIEPPSFAANAQQLSLESTFLLQKPEHQALYVKLGLPEDYLDRYDSIAIGAYLPPSPPYYHTRTASCGLYVVGYKYNEMGLPTECRLLCMPVDQQVLDGLDTQETNLLATVAAGVRDEHRKYIAQYKDY
jgi:hypothetical protein